MEQKTINIFDVVGGKAAVSTEDGEAFAKSLNLPFYECSAKIGGENISQIYSDLVKFYLDTHDVETK